MKEGRSGLLFHTAEFAVTAGLSTRFMARWRVRRVHDAASVLYLVGALAYRFAWVEGGKASATKHSDVAAMGRGTNSLENMTEVPRGARMPSQARRAGRAGSRTGLWSETVRRVSLAVERLLPF